MTGTYTPNLVILAHSFSSYRGNETWTDGLTTINGQHYEDNSMRGACTPNLVILAHLLLELSR